MADLPPKVPYLGTDYPKFAKEGYDKSFLKLDKRPDWTVTPVEANPFVHNVVTAIYLNTADIGTKEADPRRSWNATVDWINRRLTGPYTRKFSLFDSDTIGVKVVTEDDFILLGDDFKLDHASKDKSNEIWSVQQILDARDRLRLLQPSMKFSPIPRVWSKKIVDELFKMAWVRVTSTQHVDFQGVPAGNPDHQDSTSQDISEVSTLGFAAYTYDMNNGLGEQTVTWPSAGFPTSTTALLQFWAEQDRVGDKPAKIRGKAIDYFPTHEQVHAEGEGPVDRTYELFGQVPDYMVGGSQSL